MNFVAVHGLVFLNLKGQCLSSEALAENICTNPARVRKVMAKLKKAGLVSTKEEATEVIPEKAAGEISLRQVSGALEIQFVSSHWRSGSQDMDCMVASGMADVMDYIYSGLDALCQKRLEAVTIADVSGMLVEKNQGKKLGCSDSQQTS